MTRISRALIVAFICVTILAFLCPRPVTAATALDGPPLGLIASTATLDDVLKGFDKARAASSWATLIESGNVTMYGLHGTFRELADADNDVTSFNLGPISYKDGIYENQAWTQNPNGIVTLQHDTHQANEIARAALFHHARNHNAGLTLAGESPAFSAYVVEVHAKGGRHEWMFFDKANFRLIRSEQVYPTKRVIVTYDDFRTQDGITTPWHWHHSDGHPQNDEDFVTTSERFNNTIDPAQFVIPQSREDLVQFPAAAQRVALPARIIDGRVIVRVTIGGRGYDFQLDSGASSIVVDAGMASRLGLTMLGQTVQEAGGSFTNRQAIVPEMHIGDIVMKNVVVDVTSFTQQEDAATRVVGLLGFDFIANAGVKIDYAKGTVEASPPFLFVPPPDGQAIDAVWDDGVPRVAIQIGDAPAHFIFDTGADDGTIYQRFVQNHPDSITPVADTEGGLRGSGVGGGFALRRVLANVVTIAGVNYQRVPLWEIVNDPGFEYEDYDGLLGYQLLRNFTVYIDYRDSHIYLVQNKTH